MIYSNIMVYDTHIGLLFLITACWNEYSIRQSIGITAHI